MRTITTTFLLLLIGAGVVSGTDKEDSSDLQIFEFTVAGMSCDNCAETATNLLIEVPGVREAQVDFKTKQARVVADPKVGREDLRQAVASMGFEALFPGEEATSPLTEKERAGLDIQFISDGRAVGVENLLAPGKITIFDYFADWCGPCHLLSPKLERLLLVHEGLALRKIDIGDWTSDAAKQATKEFHLPGLPFVRVFGADGELLGIVLGNHIEKVEELIAGGQP